MVKQANNKMESFRIESLEINKIGAFEHIKMDFPKKTDPDKAEIHILTGENGTGKSTILMLLASLADKSNDDNIFKRKHFFKERRVWIGIEYNYLINLNIFGESIIFKRLLYEDDKTESLIVSDRLQVNKQENSESTEYAFFAYSGNRFTKSELISESEYKGIDPFKNAVDFLTVKDSKNFLTWILSNKTKALIDFSNGGILGESKYDTTIKKIEEIIFEIIGMKIQFVLHSFPNIHVAIKLNDMLIDIDTLPDGIKSIISWLGDLLMRLDSIDWTIDSTNKIPIFEQNFILFLDEIEVHLHPAWQRKILPVVQKLFKNAQIFISTHSPFVVGSVDGAWIHKLKKDGAFAVLDGEPVLSEDAESYDTILEEVFGIKERFGDEIEDRLEKFRDITKEILKGDEHRLKEWQSIISFFKNQERPDEIMSYITPQIRQINRIRNQILS